MGPHSGRPCPLWASGHASGNLAKARPSRYEPCWKDAGQRGPTCALINPPDTRTRPRLGPSLAPSGQPGCPSDVARPGTKVNNATPLPLFYYHPPRVSHPGSHVWLVLQQPPRRTRSLLETQDLTNGAQQVLAPRVMYLLLRIPPLVRPEEPISSLSPAGDSTRQTGSRVPNATQGTAK